MSEELPPAMETEFDQLAGWTERVLKDLNPDDAIAAACRGSGNPAALAWLAEKMHLARSTTFLDVGGGLGGPAAWLKSRWDVSVVIAEPMPRAAAAAHRLWNIPSTVAWAEHLPFPDACFGAAWALGVLDTTQAKAQLLAELHRVLCPTGHLGLLAYERAAADVDDDDFPEGNEFASAHEMHTLLDLTGWTIADHLDVSTLPPPPHSWQLRADDVADQVTTQHRGDEAIGDLQSQGKRLSRLLERRIIVPRLYHAVWT
jgi:SAM-dependent methyltransferase